MSPRETHHVRKWQLMGFASLPTHPTRYWWEEKIENSNEQLIYLKTTKEKYPALEAAILKIHPYDTPEILCLPVEGGLGKYLGWMVKETA